MSDVFDFIHVTETNLAAEENFIDDNKVDEILVRSKVEGSDDVNYEFIISWYDYSFEEDYRVMEVEIFSDALKALADMDNFFERLSELHEQNPSPEKIKETLINAGFQDATNEI